MQMSPARTRTGNADMQSAAFQTDGEITRNNTNQNFNQRDRNSRSDRDQTADERQAHPDRGYEPNVSEHKKTPSAWKESLAHAVFPVLPRKANSIAVAGVYRIFASIQGVRQAMPLPHNDRVFGGLHLEALAEIKLTADGIVDQEIFCTFAFHPAVVNQVSAVHYGKRLTHIVIGDHDG